MATFVLLPGAFAGGWYLRPLATRLHKAGHDAYTFTYTGLGERSHLLTHDIGLDTHILDVLQMLHYEDIQRVILVGKSYSGMVMTAVADRMPERIRHLVYLDAAVPADEQSLVNLMELRIVAAITEFVNTHGDGWLVPADTSVDARLTSHPWKTAVQPVKLTGDPAAMRIPRTYIYCTGKEPGHITATFTAAGRTLAKASGWGYYEIPSTHEPEIEMPDELAAILLELT
jgi:pimeloyl-ACP methyl ester carboxylesterase